MIPLNFYLFWAGKNISYLRYLTFKTLRNSNPNSNITLYVSRGFNKDIHKWSVERQDFEIESSIDYLKHIKDLDVKVIELEYFSSPNYCAIYQADLYRFWVLHNEGGFYLDCDQIILKSFEDLPLDKEFIYSRYIEPQCGDYLPTGVLGMSKGSNIGKIAMKIVPKIYSPYNYNSSGPFAMREIIKNIDLSNSFNAPQEYFYPVHSSKDVDKIYNGEFRITDKSYAIHWYAGHPLSQEFNKSYTEEFSKGSNDTISKYLRENNLILRYT